jgi:mRNA interferase MazF
MVTSAANPAWPGDVPVSNLRGAGLPAPSVVRPAKIMTLNASGIVRRLGALPKADQVQVVAAVRVFLAQ